MLKYTRILLNLLLKPTKRYGSIGNGNALRHSDLNPPNDGKRYPKVLKEYPRGWQFDFNHKIATHLMEIPLQRVAKIQLNCLPWVAKQFVCF